MYADHPTVTPSEAVSIMAVAIRARITVMLHGKPSTAKSAMTHQLADDYNLQLIDMRLSQAEPQDLLGFPDIDKERRKAGYVPMDTFPLEGDPLPKGKDGWLLFLDESSHIFGEPIEKALYKLSFDRMVGNDRLHPRCAVVMAGNTIMDGDLNGEMSAAQKTRVLHLVVRPDPEGFVQYAKENNFHYKIQSYLQFQPDHIYTYEEGKSEGRITLACNRTWEFVNDVFKVDPEIDKKPYALAVLSGLLDVGVARTFLAYLAHYGELPQISEVVLSPETARVPQDPGPQYAMASSLGANATEENCEAFVKYLNRFPVEMQICALRQMISSEPALLQHPALTPWKTKHTQEFM